MLLWPPLSIDVLPPADLLASRTELSAAAGGPLDLYFDLGPGDAGHLYQLFANFSGSGPGVQVAGTQLPLISDRLLALTSGAGAVPPLFQGFRGALDTRGRARARFDLPPGLASPLVGTTLRFAGVIRGDAPGELPAATGVQAVSVLP